MRVRAVSSRPSRRRPSGGNSVDSSSTVIVTTAFIEASTRERPLKLHAGTSELSRRSRSTTAVMS